MVLSNRAAGVCAVVIAGVGAAASADLVSISFPESVTLSGSTTQLGPRTVAAPFDFSGIGHIVNPSVSAPGTAANSTDFALHQTVGVVDVTDVVVTYEYDAPVLIDAFDIVQHHNGVSTLEVLVGNSLDSMTSIGTDSVPANAIEYFVHRFDYSTALTGRLVQLRLTEPELPGQGGWAMYRAYPVLVPGAGTGLTAGLGLLVAGRRRR